MQQLAAARTHGLPAGVPPSDLREKLVQTDHTELSQVRTQSELWCLAIFITVMMSSVSCCLVNVCFLTKAYLFCVLLQTTMHRDLYMEALSRISELELDGSSLQNLIQCMQDMRINMVRARYHKHDLLGMFA